MREGSVDAAARAFTVGDLTIGPDLTRRGFLASDEGRAAQLILRNEPWCSWSVDARIDDEHWNFALYFHGDALARWGLAGPSVHSGIDPKEGSAGVTVVYRE